jgi:AAA15 family ATPase/GTPase
MSVKMLDNYESNILKVLIEKYQNKTFIFEKLNKNIVQFSEIDSDFLVIIELDEYYVDKKDKFYSLFQLGNLIGYRNYMQEDSNDIPETHNFTKEIDMDMFYNLKETFGI